MVGTSKAAASAVAGLGLRLGMCRWAHLQRREQHAPDLWPEANREHLRRMKEVPRRGSPKLFGYMHYDVMRRSSSRVFARRGLRSMRDNRRGRPQGT